MSEETTRELVDRAKRGEASAFEALVRLHLRAAYAVGLAVSGNPADAEDLAQEGFMVAFQRLEDCRDPDRFGSWLTQIVRNRSLNRAEQSRSRERGLELLSAGHAGAVAAEPELAERRTRLLAALAELSSRQREVVLLHDLEAWTHPEIAAALGVSEVNARQLLFVARQKLRTLLSEDAPEVKRGS